MIFLCVYFCHTITITIYIDHEPVVWILPPKYVAQYLVILVFALKTVADLTDIICTESVQ